MSLELNTGYSLTEEDILNNSKLILLPTVKYGKNGIQRKIQRILIRCSLINYVCRNTNKNSKVIVYHSLGYLKTISFLKKIKHFKLILEVEEIYADVIENKKIRISEMSFLKKADAYIFPTMLLNEEINLDNKPYSRFRNI